jgi:hypothetical protein
MVGLDQDFELPHLVEGRRDAFHRHGSTLARRPWVVNVLLGRAGAARRILLPFCRSSEDIALPQPPERLFDRRVVERFIRRGLTTREDYERYLSGLTDAGGNVASVELGESEASTRDETASTDEQG